jgi:nucleoside-diphosphate-sugar epimerase
VVLIGEELVRDVAYGFPSGFVGQRLADGPMNVLITGAYGFVGVNLVRRFAVDGHNVLALDCGDPDPRTQRFLGAHSSRILPIVSDINDEDLEERVPRPIDLAVHAAAVTPLAPGEESRSSVEAVSVNVAGTARLLRAAKMLGAHRFIYVSSGSVYGPNTRKPSLDERTPLRPASVYGISKLAAELIARRLSVLERLPTVVVRLAQPYGPMERITSSRHLLSPVHDWCHAGLRGQPFRIGDGHLARDYTYIDDVAELVYRLAVNPVRYDTYNVGCGIDTTLADLLNVVGRHFPEAQTEPGGNYLNAAVVRAPLNPARAAKETGWTAAYSIQQGVAAYVRWLKDDLSR